MSYKSTSALGFKFINVKKFHSKNFKRKFNIFIAEFPTRKVCINHWNLVNEQKQPLKKVFCKNGYSSKWLFWEYQTDCMIKIFQKYQWRSSILVKLQTYSLQLLRTRHFYRHILILLALNSNSYFVQYNDQKKKRCEITQWNNEILA